MYHRPYFYVEEAMANAYAFRKLRLSKFADFKDNFLLKSPPGYKDFGNHITKETFDIGGAKIISEMLKCAIGETENKSNLAIGDHNLDFAKVPIHLVEDL
jgi:hypothetical protein